MRKIDVKLDLDVCLDTSKIPPFSVQSDFDVPNVLPESKYDKRFFSPITSGGLRSLYAKPKKVFKNDKCSDPFPVIGFYNEVICYLPCGLCDSCKEVKSKNRSRKNGKGKKTN